MSWQEFTALFVLCTAMSFTPGPNTMLATALGANHGLRRALPFCLAVPAGWTVLMLATGLGLGALVGSLPVLRWAIKAVGIAYLVWLALGLMGLGLMGLAGRAGASGPSARHPAGLKVTFAQGVALQFVNIKAWLLALTLAVGWVAVGANTGQRLAIVCLTMLGFAFASNFTYALLGAVLRQWLAQGRRLQWFNRAMALLLLATAGWMLRA